MHVQQAREWHATGEALVHDALHDPLTALPNRVLLHDRLAGALTRLQRSRSSVALLFADLDGFKAVNDRYGHAAGDQVLVAIAHRLLSVQRAADTVCRYGGDEFVVLCENTSRAQADAVAARLRSALAPAIRLVVGGPDDPAAQVAVSAVLTASIGVAATSDPHTSAEQLLQNADSQMYRAKRSRALPG